MSDSKVKLEAEISANSKGLQDAVKEASGVLADAKKKVEEQNAEMRKGISVMQPLKDATARIRDGWESIRKTARDAGGGFKGVAAAMRQCWDYATRFRQETRGGEVDAKGMESVMRGITGKLMGVGAVFAAMRKAWQGIVALAKEYVRQLDEANKARAYGNAAEGAEDMSRAREKRDKEYVDLADKLKKFAELVDEENRSGSLESWRNRQFAQKDLKDLYGFEFEEGASMDKQIAAQLDKLKQKRLEAINAQLKANQRVIDGANELIDKKGGYWSKVGATLLNYVGMGDDPSNTKAIKEAQSARDKAANQNLELIEQRNWLQKQTAGVEFSQLRNAKKLDEEEKERVETEKERAAEEERQAKALADAEAQKKREAEQTQRQVEQYRDAYKTYISAQRGVTEAQKNYARAVRDNAREAREEAIQQRRERLQKRMSRFGFSIYEGFSLGEGVSSRRRRQRNTLLDEGIAEKMSLSERGERVRWTGEERRRIRELQSLQKKDKQLEAAQKQMAAAEKQERAAESLRSAAGSIRSAIWGRDDAGRVLTARGASLAGARASRNYGAMFQQLHRDLQQLNQRIYIVK